MTITDALLIFSTLISPLIAVRVSRYLDHSKEVAGRKEWIYKTLMATRSYNLAPLHVEALNRISLEFSSTRPKEKAVLDSWEQYLDHLGRRQDGTWGEKRVDLMVELLRAMGLCLGYNFNGTQIKNGIYMPTAHGDAEADQLAIRRMMVEILSGTRPFPIKAFSPPENAAARAGGADQSP